jgi:hypothetical protein
MPEIVPEVRRRINVWPGQLWTIRDEFAKSDNFYNSMSQAVLVLEKCRPNGGISFKRIPQKEQMLRSFYEVGPWKVLTDRGVRTMAENSILQFYSASASFAPKALD